MAFDSPHLRPVVTISAPYGAGGSIVGPRLAKRLGAPFVDRVIPVAVSNRLHIPLEDAISITEIPQRTLSRLVAHFAPVGQLLTGAPIVHESPNDEEACRLATEQVLMEYAAEGAVILGRAGAIVLHEVPGALHVRLDSTPARRLVQGMRLNNTDRESAKREMQASDLARENYVRYWYRAEPADPRHYHLVVDSTRIDLDSCVELLAVAAVSRGEIDATV